MSAALAEGYAPWTELQRQRLKGTKTMLHSPYLEGPCLLCSSQLLAPAALALLNPAQSSMWLGHHSNVAITKHSTGPLVRLLASICDIYRAMVRERHVVSVIGMDCDCNEQWAERPATALNSSTACERRSSCALGAAHLFQLLFGRLTSLLLLLLLLPLLYAAAASLTSCFCFCCCCYWVPVLAFELHFGWLMYHFTKCWLIYQSNFLQHSDRCDVKQRDLQAAGTLCILQQYDMWCGAGAPHESKPTPCAHLVC